MTAGTESLVGRRLVVESLKSLAVCLLFLQAFASGSALKEPYGVELGDFEDRTGLGVTGKVYAVDEKNLYIKDFTYDGKEDAFFWVRTDENPSTEGIIVKYPEGANNTEEPRKLPALNNVSFLLRLPQNTTIRSIKSLAVWNQEKTESLGSVVIPKDVAVPMPKVLPEFSRLAHDLRSGNVTILDARTFLIPDLHYDGKGPDAYFMVGTGSKPHGKGTKVPNELGDLNVLRAYRGQTIAIQLPENLTVYNIDWLVMWCIQYKHNFGYVTIPKDLNVPPALGQNKIGVLVAGATHHHLTFSAALLSLATFIIMY
ncbi:protein Skeletor, isoforms B/C-like [Cloeon dipterum]|uniref:protein Skeletor, isoforms B/C-like n=1 Tax=Cloeon dipterum TaxID=197152 RepID=UPI0032206DF5